VTKLNQKLADQSAEMERLKISSSELEELVASNRVNADKTAAQLAEQLAAKTTEVEKLTAGNKDLDHQLDAKTKQLEQLTVGKKELDQQLAEKSKKVEELAAAKLAAEQQAAAAGKATESESSQQVSAAKNLESQLSAVTAAKQQLQLELSVLKVDRYLKSIFRADYIKGFSMYTYQRTLFWVVFNMVDVKQ
jgi:flagellar biosynthesis GTPase FlhF